MDKMREEFEKSNCYRGSMRIFGEIAERYGLENGDYHNLEDRTSWEAWKASRESLVVELPHMADYVNMLGQVDKCYSYLDDLHAAIHAAGIRTK